MTTLLKIQAGICNNLVYILPLSPISVTSIVNKVEIPGQ
uniref:Xylosyltransferase 1-like n=1 Tax=Rhizophora mucronata TaxID=61149 RepID=A0A2P2IZ17_RHIMU